MANKVIKKSILQHYWDEPVSYTPQPERPEPDKTKSISELSRQELWDMLSRLRDETEIQRVLRELKRSSGERETPTEAFKIDTKTPINQLYHHGIKDQKWGVRRFQNKDGTRTAAGKKRYSDDVPKSDDHTKSRESKSKGTSGLSNDDLKKLNERLKLEEDYARLTKIEKSESWVKKAIQTAGQQAVTEFTKGVFLGSAKLLVKEMSPQFAEVAFGLKDTERANPASPTSKQKKKGQG